MHFGEPVQFNKNESFAKPIFVELNGSAKMHLLNVSSQLSRVLVLKSLDQGQFFFHIKSIKF